MKKNLGLILLTIGIGLSAGFGAELAPNFRHETKINGIAGFGEAIASQKHADYCKTLTVNKLPPVEGCADEDGNPVLLPVANTRANTECAASECSLEATESCSGDARTVRASHYTFTENTNYDNVRNDGGRRRRRRSPPPPPRPRP